METTVKKGFSANIEKLAKLAMLLECGGIQLFEYDRGKDQLVIYDENLQIKQIESSYLKTIQENPRIVEEDCWKAEEFFSGHQRGPVEICVHNQDGSKGCKLLDASPVHDDARGELLLGYIQDVTMVTEREHHLEELSRRDSLTGLYNHAAGKALVSQYLHEKDPYASCGLMIIDIDYFKNVNDNYGHPFGDEVLKELAGLLELSFAW